MDADPPLEYLLDANDEPPSGAEELRAIVAGSRRRRERWLTAGMAATLAVGVVAGWLVAPRHGGGGGGTTLAAGGAAVPAVSGPALASGSGASSASGAPAIGVGTAFTLQFTRTTTDGVTIRSYQSPPSSVRIPTPPGCPVLSVGPLVEVSTADIANASPREQASATAPFVSYGVTTVGVVEGHPVYVATAQVAANVAAVRATFMSGQTDQMQPVGGWVVLAHTATSSAQPGTGFLEALDASGKVMGRLPLSLGPTELVIPAPPAAAASNSATAGGPASSLAAALAGGSSASPSTVPATPTPPPVTVASGPAANSTVPGTTPTTALVSCALVSPGSGG